MRNSTRFGRFAKIYTNCCTQCSAQARGDFPVEQARFSQILHDFLMQCHDGSQKEHVSG